MKQAIVLRQDLDLSRGKMVAQGAHASLKAYRNTDEDKLKEWEKEGEKKVVLTAGSDDDLIDLKNKAGNLGISTALIKDRGLTEIPPGTLTALGLGPDSEEKIDRVTGHLSLLD